MNHILIIGLMLMSIVGCSSTPQKYSEPKDQSCLSGNCTNGYGMRKYGDRQTYDGNFSDSQRDGEGTYNFPNGISYRGKWSKGNLTGTCERRENANEAWKRGMCKHENNTIIFINQEEKRKLLKKKAIELNQSIQSM